MPADQFRESGFGMAFDVIPEQLLVGQIVHSFHNTQPIQNRTKKSSDRFVPKG
jgi:hypothetical protein